MEKFTKREEKELEYYSKVRRDIEVSVACGNPLYLNMLVHFCFPSDKKV